MGDSRARRRREGREDNLETEYRWGSGGSSDAPVGRRRLLEFNPLAAPNLVRYVRANVTTVSAPITLAFSRARSPHSGSTPTTSTNLAVVTTSATSEGALPAQGGLAAEACSRMPLGNEVNFATLPIAAIPADVICTGSSNSLVPAGGPDSSQLAPRIPEQFTPGEEVICIRQHFGQLWRNRCRELQQSLRSASMGAPQPNRL